ncbi:MAG: S-layer homology domain-containing protein [Clostridia bacterium]|nr:S-layer homology domain-containing protein [Clostridia bacterium]
MKRLVCFLLTVIMLCGMIPVAAIAEDGALSFTDVQEKHWFYDAVKYCVEKGYIAGMDDTTFAPNNNLTRAQFVTILAKFDGVDLTQYDTTDAGFEDVKTSHWWNEVVCWAVEQGITSGISETKFGPNNDVTRSQLARFFYVYTEKTGGDVSGRADISEYPDVDKVQTWAEEPLKWAVSVGLISGVKKDDVNYLEPNGKATRAQAAVMFMNYDQMETEIVIPDYDGRIVFWGDSLTQGITGGFKDITEVPFPERVGETLNCEIKNYGIGSEAAFQVASRQGGLPMYAFATEDEPFVIPAEGSVEICLFNPIVDEIYSVTNYVGVGEYDLYSGINPVTIGGVVGEVKQVDGSNWSFTRLEAGEEVKYTEHVLVETFGMTDKSEDDIIVIWIGHNDCPEAFDDEKHQEIIGYIDAMIEYSGTDKYVVMGLMAERYAPGYAEINAKIEAYLTEKGAGDKYLDIRTYLADPARLEELGIEPNQGDNTMDLEWMEKGWIPESLQAEKVSKQGYSLHLNQYGYDLVAGRLVEKFIELGYLDEEPVVDEVVG